MINIELYPSAATLPISLILIDKDCQEIDSIIQTGTIVFSHLATYDGWYTLRIRNASSTQPGQKCWVKATYFAPQTVETNVVKNKCACAVIDPNVGIYEDKMKEIVLSPNPFVDEIDVQFPNVNHGFNLIQILNLEGKVVKVIPVETNQESLKLDLADLSKGSYMVRFVSDVDVKSQLIIK
jgi:alpha-amylase